MQEKRWEFADQIARYWIAEFGFAPVAGRVLGYLTVCDPAQPSINELADALLASRSAITQAVVLLESRGMARRTRARGERVDRIAVILDVDIAERDLDSAGYRRQAELLRRGVALLGQDDSGRREALEELAGFNDFLADRLPVLREEWRARRTDHHTPPRGPNR